MTHSILAKPVPLGPEWLAHRYDEATGQIRFVDYDRAARSAIPFLTDDYLPPRDYRALSRQEAQAIGQSAPVHFIFHSGFCCSTLLAACLDLPGLASGFSEPMILNDVSGWRRRGGSPDAIGPVLADALRLLARPFPGDQASVVKPSNVVNGLAGAMLAIQPQARAVVMHAPLSDFLVSIAKKGLDGRHWVRELFVKLRAEGRVQHLGFNDLDFLGQTDLQVAAMAWLAQQSLFADLIAKTGGRVRSLDSAAFMTGPEAAIRQVAGHFGLALSEDQLSAIAAGALARDSKNGRSFSAADREAEYRRMHALYGDEIDKVAIWTAQVAASQGLALDLKAPILSAR
jgi:hypothetical protein